MNVATFGHDARPIVASLAIKKRVFEVDADVAGRDLASVAPEIEKILDTDRPKTAKVGERKRRYFHDPSSLARPTAQVGGSFLNEISVPLRRNSS